MLYLVSTPIGNLKDITYRAIEVLQSCDYILCEDTRHSLPLLTHYHIRKPLKSYHQFNESESEKAILEDLSQGKTLCLISDAGTPGISDPGSRLVASCLLQGYKVIPIPGACAAIAALSSSGLNTDLFQFVGFLPRKNQELRSSLQSILQYKGTTICYESPQRLLKTLEALQNLAPDRNLVILRELTKKFEERLSGTVFDVLIKCQNNPPKGEIVLLIEGEFKSTIDWSHLSPIEHVDYLEKTYSLPKREAIKMAAELRQVSKRSIYNLFNKKEDSQQQS